jgi:Zinc dependent phospholipase C
LGNPSIEDNRNYFLLGSLGPDLPYYRNVFGTAIGTFFEEKFNPDSPGFYSCEGDYFHSRTPNLFPMKMLETIRRDKDPNTEGKKFAFGLGYLTHVAADQHIHPSVEQYAGPFYVSGVNRKRHRTLEVYQDILLYENVTGKKFFDEDFPPWFDVGLPQREVEIQTIGTEGEPVTEKRLLAKTFTLGWFRSFIQRAFLETYSSIIDGDEIEEWVKGFNSVFKFLKSIGPYHDAYKNIAEDSEEAREFIRMFYGEETNYLLKCFDPAKELSKKYISLANVFFNSSHISDKERNELLSLIPDADLISPLVDL